MASLESFQTWIKDYFNGNGCKDGFLEIKQSLKDKRV